MFIEVRELRFSYPFAVKMKAALDGVSLKISRGEFVSIIGPEASGKSTLLQHLNGLLSPESGEVLLDGKRVGSEISKREAIGLVGLVFQSPESQLFEETVFSDIAFALKNLAMSPDQTEEAVKRAMGQVGLDFESFKDRSPFALSGGEKRRVAIAGVLVTEPKCLALDEPMSGLDGPARRDLLKLLKDLVKGAKITVVMVTHDMNEAARLSDRIIVLDKGRVILSGSPGEVFKKATILEGIGLELPQGPKLAAKLRTLGLEVGDESFNEDEIAAAIATKLKGGEG